MNPLHTFLDQALWYKYFFSNLTINHDIFPYCCRIEKFTLKHHLLLAYAKDSINICVEKKMLYINSNKTFLKNRYNNG